MDRPVVLIVGAEIGGERLDARLGDGRIIELGDGLERGVDQPVVEARGGALVPALHDRHLHLLALAAALGSVDCGPPRTTDRPHFEAKLREATPQHGWIRGTGYFESVAGPLDRRVLDGIRDDIPIRIQHRSGAMWFVNSPAVEALGLEKMNHDAIERDETGCATGRLFRADEWIRSRLPGSPPDLAPVGRLLAASGVTRVTDCTPANADAEVALLRAAQASGDLLQDIEMMGRIGIEATSDERLSIGAHKIMLDEPALPSLVELSRRIEDAHAEGRAVAFHCVTRTELHFALAALDAAGARPGDRIEHASVAPPEAMESVARLGLAIVTQPNFVAERGDAYLAEVAARDRPHLYRVRSWLERGVDVAGGTDAPFGAPDPWQAMRAAVERRAPSGNVVGPDERLCPEEALALFLPDWARDRRATSSAAPPLAIGDPADLCLLDERWSAARSRLSRDTVAATWRAGTMTHLRLRALP